MKTEITVGDGKYTVSINRCNCHPETCCCDPYRVNKPDGAKYATFYEKSTAVDVCDALNKRMDSNHE